MNMKAKGSRRERQSAKLLEACGYRVTKSAASLGCWDLVGIAPDGFVLVQCKSNRPPCPAERETLAMFQVPSNCRKLIYIWHDRKRLPQVIEL